MRADKMCVVMTTLVVICTLAKGETFTINDNRPVAYAAADLEARYGWPITYEDPPWIYEGDLIDVTAQVRKDGKSAGVPGVVKILVPRPGSFSFELTDRPWTEPGTRAPEDAARSAIKAMLKAYSATIGGIEVFTLTESSGMFHIVPIQRLDESGRMARITPLLDKIVSISPGQRSVMALVKDVLENVIEGEPAEVSPPQTLRGATAISPLSGESARSVLSRLFAEQAMPVPMSWDLFYRPGSYGFNVHAVAVGKPRYPSRH
jgi:hypothetical protein